MSALPSLFEKHDVSVDAALAALPFDDCGFAKLAPVEENVDGHGKSHSPHADINPAVTAFIVRHFVQEARQNLVQIPHSHSLNTTERFGIEECRSVNGKRPAALNVPFLPTAFEARRMAVSA